MEKLVARGNRDLQHCRFDPGSIRAYYERITRVFVNDLVEEWSFQEKWFQKPSSIAARIAYGNLSNDKEEMNVVLSFRLPGDFADNNIEGGRIYCDAFICNYLRGEVSFFLYYALELQLV